MSTAPRRKSYAWLWFFVLVFAASIGVAGFMIWFNLRLQLTPERLAEAMQHWKEHGPRDYVMTVSKRIGNADRVDTIVAKVRGGTVIEVRLNGEPLRDQETDERFPAGHPRLQYYTMDHLLREIERFLELDERAKWKAVNRALFDEESGALRWYLRSVRGTGEHVEETVKLEPLPP
jgi:hypothetical protein